MPGGSGRRGGGNSCLWQRRGDRRVERGLGDRGACVRQLDLRGCKKSMTVQPYRSANCCRRFRLTALCPFSMRQMVALSSPSRQATIFWVRPAFLRRCRRLRATTMMMISVMWPPSLGSVMAVRRWVRHAAYRKILVFPYEIFHRIIFKILCQKKEKYNR